MSSLDEYMEKLDCLDEAERIYAAEDIGYLNTPEGVPASVGTVGQGTFAGGSRRHIPGPDPDRRGRRHRGFHPACSEATIPRFATRLWMCCATKAPRSIPFLKTVMRDGDKDMRKLVLDVLKRNSGRRRRSDLCRPRLATPTRTW